MPGRMNLYVNVSALSKRDFEVTDDVLFLDH